MTSLKGILRRHWPSAYRGMVRLRGSSIIRGTIGTPRRVSLRCRWLVGQPITVDVAERMGLGASLTHIVALHSHFSAGDVKVICRNPLYTTPDHPELVDIFFERLGAADRGRRHTVRYRFHQDVSLRDPSSRLTLESANKTFHEHYRIKDEYLGAARRIASECGDRFLGVHFRGGDKHLEYRATAWDKMRAAVERCLALRKLERIFVATDEAGFLEFMKAHFGARRISSIDCAFLSTAELPAHFAPGDNLKKGEEAFVTMLVLSQSNFCVRTPSYLSGFSKILNPDLPVLTLSSSTPSAFPETRMGNVDASFANLASAELRIETV